MAGEVGDVQINSTIESPITTRAFEKVVLPVGRYTEVFFQRYPSLRKLNGITPEIYVSNPDQLKVLIAIAGFQDKHTKLFLEGHGAELAKDSNDTVITLGWPKLSDVVDLKWRAIADYLIANGKKEISFFGTSYGGRESLIALKKLRQLSSEGFETPIKDVVVVVAPVNKESIQPISRMGIPNWLMVQATQKVEPFITPISTLFPSLRADAVRVRELLQGEQFKLGDFQEGQTIHYFGTDKEGQLDPLVNQPIAIRQLRELGTKVIEHWYKPDPKIAHYPDQNELPRMVNDAKSIFGQ